MWGIPRRRPEQDEEDVGTPRGRTPRVRRVTVRFSPSPPATVMGWAGKGQVSEENGPEPRGPSTSGDLCSYFLSKA